MIVLIMRGYNIWGGGGAQVYMITIIALIVHISHVKLSFLDPC
jgi:hypothetical protein